MTLTSRSIRRPALRRTAVALALATACAGVFAALPQFTLDPSLASTPLNGTSFTADNIIISDYSLVTLSGSTFTDTGFLSVSALQLGGATLIPTGLNSTYGMYFAFTGHGTTTAGDPTLVQTSGNFTDLTYTLYGYNGSAASFDVSGSTPAVSGPSATYALASGSLIDGTVSTTPTGDGRFTPSAAAQMSFAVAAGQDGFFADPKPFYDLAFAAFTNTRTQVIPVIPFDGSFRIFQGGGAVNFAAAVPEPETYALMLAGLGAIGFVARRRSSRTA